MINKFPNFFKNKKKEEEELTILPLSTLIEDSKIKVLNKAKKDGIDLENPSKATKKLIKKLIKNEYRDSIKMFYCEKNPKMADFINEIGDNTAISWEMDNKSRTFFLVDNKKSKEEETVVIVAFFTLGITAIKVNIEESPVSKSTLGKIFKDGLVGENYICYLIGKLAKNDTYKERITGKEIIEYSAVVFEETSKKIGRSVILIEAYVPKVVSIYKGCNFDILQEIEEKSGKKRVQLVRILNV